MLLSHGAPRGLFYFAENLKHGWVKILHCRWAMCVCCCYVFRVGGLLPNSFKICGVGSVMRSPHH